MSAVMTFPTQFEGYSNLGVSSDASPGVSLEARKLNGYFEVIRERLRDTARFGNKLIGLENAYVEASEPDWDGYGAVAADRDSYFRARELLGLLPDSMPVPEFSVDPDGEISIEWVLSKSRLVTISVGSDGTLTYIGFLGSARMKGAERFDQEIPRAVMAVLERIIPRN